MDKLIARTNETFERMERTNQMLLGGFRPPDPAHLNKVVQTSDLAVCLWSSIARVVEQDLYNKESDINFVKQHTQ